MKIELKQNKKKKEVRKKPAMSSHSTINNEGNE
jgi:hypothetical protein